MKRAIVRFVILLTAVLIFQMSIFADEIPGVDEYLEGEIYEALPDDVRNAIESGESYTGPKIDESIDFIISLIGKALSPVLNTFFLIIGVVLLCACFYMLAGIGDKSAASRMYRFLASVCLAILVFNILGQLWNELSTLLKQMNSLMNSITLATTSVYALSGAVTSAAVNESSMMIILTIIEDLTYYGTYPILQICFGMSFISCITESIDLSAISGLIRKTFTTVLIILMSIMTAVLSFQSTLAESNDSLIIRTVKLASGSFVPIVGNAVSEATKTVAAGLGSLKTSLGVICIIALIATVLPLFITLWLNKLSFSIGSALSEVLGLDREAIFLRGSGELIDFAIAIIAAITLIFIINLMIFAKSAVVCGG